MDIDDVCSELKIKYDTGRKTVRSLIKKGVLAYAKVGTVASDKIEIKSLVANPYIYVRGTKESREIAGLFDNNGWEDLLI